MFGARSTASAIVVANLALMSAVALHVDAAESTTTDDASELEIGWYARFDTTAGPFVIRLLPEQAPQSVAHFTALADGRLEWLDPYTGAPMNEPYYDGLEIHKVRAAQRFEFGDPTATGRGAAPFYVPEEVGGAVDFSVGWRVGMTRARFGRISGSLLFVTAAAQPFLNHRHPCFGIVVSGQDVVYEITNVKADSSGKPLEPVRVHEVRVFSVGEPGALPEPKRYTPPRREFGLNPDLERQLDASDD